jgi:2,3-bisphosphoglycerate-dependent phosphoglycerate mutase
VVRHHGSQAALVTHGNLLTLMLNALDPGFGYQFWRQLSFPDIYQLTFAGEELRGVERLWDAG